MNGLATETLQEYLLLFGWSTLGALLMAGLCGYVGAFMVMRRMTFLVDTLGHASILGLALALTFNLFPQFVLLPYTVSLGLLLTWLARRHQQELNAVTAVLFSVSVSLGIMLLSLRSTGGHEVLHAFLGNLLWVGRSDVLFIIAISLPVLAFFYLRRKQLLLLMLDESLARSRNIAIDRLDYVFIACVSATLVSAIKLVGIVLIMGLISIPALTAARFAQSLKMYLFLSPVLAVLSTAIGILISMFFDLPTGSSIVLIAGLIYAVSIFLTRH